MTWIDGVLIAAAILGFAAGGFLVARSPSFWVGLGMVLFKAILPVIMKRKTPEEEAAWRKEELRGGHAPPKGTGVTTGKTTIQPASHEKNKREVR